MAYDGWTNKETWLVNLWLGDMFQELIEDGQELDSESIKERVQYILEIDNHSVESGFLVDLLNCAFFEINFAELADHYKEEN